MSFFDDLPVAPVIKEKKAAVKVEKTDDAPKVVTKPKIETISLEEFTDLTSLLTRYHNGKYRFKRDDILRKIHQLVK